MCKKLIKPLLIFIFLVIKIFMCPFSPQNFVSDFASTSREEVFAGTEKGQLLNKVICQHFYRQGLLDIAEEIAKVR
jgi:hypothetical protein